MNIQYYPVADVVRGEIDLDTTVKLIALDEGYFDIHVVTGRPNFIRQSVLRHFRIVDIVQVNTALPSALRSNEQLFLFRMLDYRRYNSFLIKLTLYFDITNASRKTGRYRR